MRRIDLRLVPAVVALWASEGLVLGLTAVSLDLVAPVRVALVLVAAALVVLAMRRPSVQRLTWVLAGVAVAVGVALASLRLAPLTAEPLRAMAERKASVTASLVVKVAPRYSASTFANSPDEVSSQQRYNWFSRAELRQVTEGGLTTKLSVPVLLAGSTKGMGLTDELIPGATVEVIGSLQPGEPSRASAAIVRVRGDPTVTQPAPHWQLAAHQLRSALANACDALAPDPRGLLPGLVVGDESKVPDDLREQMQAVGLSHLTAVSGANLAIVAGAVLLVARGLRLTRRFSVGLAAGAMFGFVVVAGFQPSVLRAAFMGAITLLALFTSLRRVGVSALAASAFLLLLIDPWMSVSLGFALSVAATGGLLAYSLSIRAQSSERTRMQRLRRISVQAVGVATAAQLATTPLVAAIGGGIPLVGVLANVLAAPAVAPATIIGVLAALLAVASPTAGAQLAALGGYPTGWISSVARWCYQVPWSTVPWLPGVPGFLLSCASLTAGYLAWRRRRDMRRVVRAFMGNRSIRPIAIGASAAVLATAIWLIPNSSGWPPPQWLMVACDVGQGDALVVRTGLDAAIVVDVGPEPAAIDSCLADLGIVTIDLLVLSHFHQDHVGGLAGALNRRVVHRSIVSPLALPAAGHADVVTQLGERGVSSSPARPGERGQVGPVEYEVLWPTRIVDSAGSAPNNSSVTLWVQRANVGLLLTGDLEPEAQRVLMGQSLVADIDVVKVPHHGSRNQASGFVDWVGPATTAIISVGADNTYGHPSGPTVKSWEDAGASVLRTDISSDIAITAGPDGSAVVLTRRQHP